jgi:hypothetical protein
VSALPSPIVDEQHLTHPGPTAGRDTAGHIIRIGERYLRLTDAAGDWYRFCSRCVMRRESGLEVVR